MKTLFVLLALLLLVSVVFAGSYTITTTPDQDAGLAYVAGVQSAAQPVTLDKDGKPVPVTTITPATYLQKIISTVLDDYARQGARAAECTKLTDLQKGVLAVCK